MSKESDLYSHYKQVIEQNRNTLIAARKVLGSTEYRKAQAYFRTLKSRGQIIERPTLENGYKIVERSEK